MAETNIKQQTKLNGGKNKFGTFGGVFTPSILTILGVIMFMRSNFVIGQSGILGAVLILIVAKIITFLTSLSVGAISTNMEVKGGGAYFMISRVLGPEFGGAIGIALFLAQALSVPFYILGFTEAVVLSFSSLEPYFQIIAYTAAIMLFLISFMGADWAIKTQYFIMVILGLSIFSFMAGALLKFSPELFWTNFKSGYTADSSGGNYNFWLIFAIYFPAVTGILAGINMSGDLKTPSKSIPRGTLYAILTGFIVYFLQAIIMGGAFERTELIERPYEILKDCAIFGTWYLVVGGVFSATLSSALGSYLGAPRILQAVSRDRILESLKPFAKGSSKGDEPVRALFLTGFITLGTIYWAGGEAGGAALNMVAAVISMFFLYTYGMINFAAFIEAYGETPSFRPTFKYFTWHTALLGAIGCISASILVDYKAALLAVILIFLLLKFLQRKRLSVRYGDARRGFVFSRVKENMLRLRSMKDNVKNWRPAILVFSGNPNTRDILVNHAVWLEARRGIIFLANIFSGKLEELVTLREAAFKQLNNFCEEKGIEAFPYVMMCDDFENAMTNLVQTAGIPPLEPNMVMLGWGPEPEYFVRILRRVTILKKSLVILKHDEQDIRKVPERIDIWWRGRKNGSLMMILAHLMIQNNHWMSSKIRVLRVVDKEEGREYAHNALEEIIVQSRVVADAEVIVTTRPFPEILKEHSKDADCIFMGFEVPDEKNVRNWYEAYMNMLSDMPVSLLICSSMVDDMLE